jgi:DNA-binding response OmpR family regulator
MSTHVASERSVLIVDRSEETRGVLQTALERRGWRILAASGADQGLDLAKTHHPDVIVLDLEAEECGPEDVCGSFAAETTQHQASLVVLGTCRVSAGGANPRQFVAKPYHYAPLIRKIEELLRASGQTPPQSRVA